MVGGRRDLILKLIVSPVLTLICVAKPWIVESPAPATSQSDVGVPGLVFSHATGLVTGVAQGSVAAWPLAGSRASAAVGSDQDEDQTPCDGHGLRQASGHARTPDFDVITRTERPGARDSSRMKKG